MDIDPDDETLHSIVLPNHIWARVHKHAKAREMTFESALAELIILGFCESPAYQ